MSPTARKRLAVAFLLLLAAALLVPPLINANRFRARIASSIGGAVGRDVRIGDVSVLLLPQPGFQLSDFQIEDDPAFNAEPLLQASSVNAYLRLSSLWRGRLEIAKLSLESPSLNLARNAEGRWNLESILQRASQVPAAPTGLATPEERPRFPYIEAQDGRVNFKLLNEKTAFALANADFAFWLESEGQWNMRLAARPLRTDANLGDTGILSISASFVKTENLFDVPIRADISLDKIQLGQFTALINGHDSGWRGDLRVTASITGTAHHLDLSSRAHISDFRRYDIATSGGLDLDLGCSAAWSPASSRFSQTGPALEDIRCEAPPGAPTLLVTGDVLIQPIREYALQVKATKVPASFLAQLARRIKRGLPDDLDASGTLDGEFTFSRGTAMPKTPVFTAVGSAAFTGLVLRSAALNSEVHVGHLQMGFTTAQNGQQLRSVLRAKPAPGQFRIQPFTLRINRSAPLEADGVLNRNQYLLRIKGGTDLQSVLVASRLFGLERARIHAAGFSRLDLALSGKWAGFSPPMVTGSVVLQGVTAQLPDISSALHMATATLELTPDFFILRNISAQLGSPALALDGRIEIPRACSGTRCPAQFDLHLPVLDVEDLNRALNPRFRTSGWFSLERFFGAPEEVTPLLRDSQAVGVVTIDKLRIRKLTATAVNAVLSLDAGRIKASQINALILGGRHSGAWSADLSASPPEYSGEGTLKGVDVARTEALLNEPLGTGTASASYELHLSGTDFGALLQSLEGSFSYRWEDGSILPASKSVAAHPLRFMRWTGTAELSAGAFQLSQGVMLSNQHAFQTSGTADLSGGMNLTFADASTTITLSGTLKEPVMAVATAAASLEPASNSRNAKSAKDSNQ